MKKILLLLVALLASSVLGFSKPTRILVTNDAVASQYQYARVWVFYVNNTANQGWPTVDEKYYYQVDVKKGEKIWFDLPKTEDGKEWYRPSCILILAAKDKDEVNRIWAEEMNKFSQWKYIKEAWTHRIAPSSDVFHVAILPDYDIEATNKTQRNNFGIGVVGKTMGEVDWKSKLLTAK